MRDGVEIIHQGRVALIILSGDAENNRCGVPDNWSRRVGRASGVCVCVSEMHLWSPACSRVQRALLTLFVLRVFGLGQIAGHLQHDITTLTSCCVQGLTGVC